MAGLIELLNEDSDDDLPANWEERITADGKIYYANHETLLTQWEHPTTGQRKRLSDKLPYGWVQKLDGNGQTYYEDTVNRRLSNVDPRLAFKQTETSAASKSHLNSKFSSRSTGFHVVRGLDLSGVYALVTGGNCGVGFATAKTLASQGAHVVITSTSLRTGIAACDQIKTEFPMADVLALQLSLCDAASTSRCATDYKALKRPLNLLILNAAVFGLPFSRSPDGVEMHFRVNHLGHFHLFAQLKDLLVASKPARVVVVCCESHHFASLSAKNARDTGSDLDRLLNPAAVDYSSLLAYNNSKLCNVVFSRELNRRFKAKGVTSNCAHPGNMIRTRLSRHWWLWRLAFTLARPFTKSWDQAAATVVYCAVDADLAGVGGFYFNNCAQAAPSPSGCDEPLAKTIWNYSERFFAHFADRQRATPTNNSDDTWEMVAFDN